jgi:DNA-binding LytR/AlgR family response regulator
VLPIQNVRYFKSANIYVELYLNDGRVELYDKSIKQLSPLLPAHYTRIHKSYIINTETIKKINTLGGGKYHVILKSGDCLPVSRKKIAEIRKLFDLNIN